MSINQKVCAPILAFLCAGLAAAQTGLIQNYAGNGTVGFSGDGGPATSASFISPFGLAVDANGNLYIAAAGNGRVQVVNAASGIITTFAGGGTGGSGGLATAAALTGPCGVAFDSAGDLYLSDTCTSASAGGGGQVIGPAHIWRVDAVTRIITIVAGGSTSGFAGDGGSATSALLSVPAGLAVDASGDIYIADAANNRIRCISAATGIITTVAGNGTATFAGDGGPATAASLNDPSAVTVDASGNLYIADTLNNRIRLVNAATGIITTLAGTGSPAFNGDGISAVSANLNTPYYISLNASGNLLIADTLNYRVRMVDMSSGLIWTLAGNGGNPGACCSGNGAQAAKAGLDIPVGLAVSPSGALFIAELQGNDVRIVSLPSPYATTAVNLSSNASSVPSGNPLVLTATLSATNGLAANATGSVDFFIGTSTFLGAGSMTNGSATFSTSTLSQGSHSINAFYSGDTAFAYAVAPAFSVTISAPQATVALAASPNPATANQAIMLTTTLTPSTATGTVTFLNGSTAIGSATITNGTATLSGVTLASGNYSLTAQYSGGNFPSATSPAISLTVKAASSVVVASSSNPSNTKQSVTFTATVTPATATGAVEFLDGSTVLGSTTVSNGVTTFTPASLSQGTHSITAAYAGDGNDTSATSAVFTQTVQASSTITLASTANPAVVGAAVTLTATVTPSTATGNVQFLDGTTVLGTVALTNGIASFTTSTLTQGSHSITAAYAGDASDTSATSTMLAQTVQNQSTVTLVSTENPAPTGMPFMFIATVTPSTATGTIQFLDGATLLGTVALSNGSATYSTPGLAQGIHSITAAYSGDTNDTAATSSLLSQSVKNIAGMSLLVSANPAVVGQTVTFSVSIGASGATGTVTFSDGSTLLATVSLASGTAAFSTSGLAQGVHTMNIAYSGDANYLGAGTTLTETILGSSSVALVSSLNPALSGQAVTFTATVTPSAATGAVQFYDGSTLLGTSSLTSGIASYSISALAAGAHSITASYGGSATYAASSSSALSEVVKTNTTVSVSSSLNPSTAGAAITFTALVSPSAATGTVQFLDGATVLGSATLSNGTASFTISTLAAGTQAISAAYSGSATYNASTSIVLSEAVKANTSVALSSSLNPAIVGSSVTFTAAVTPSTATGTLQFLNGATVIGSATLAGGSASFSTSSLSQGADFITASYGGDAADTASTSATLTETVNPAAPTAPSTLVAAAAGSSQINLTWTASATSGVTYNVYESTTSGFVPSAANRVATGVAATAYAATGLNASTTYFYRVTAANAGGESPATGQASAATAGSLACHVSYSVTSEWNNGFTGAISIENTGTTKIMSWTLTWAWPGNQKVTEAWDVNSKQSATNVTFTNESYNGQIASGATVSGIGFNASYSGKNTAPSAFSVNGALCH